jgi:DNA-binding response OmpR family regulator
VRILVVDDDAAVRRSLATALGRDGYDVVSAGDGGAALAQTSLVGVDAIVLDVAIPEPNGLEVCRRLRSRGDRTPILMLTARDLIDDRVAGLDAGADDYLIKPFATAELIARTKALLRRPGGALGTVLKAGNIIFDTIGRDVRVGEVPVLLTRREGALLEHLMRRLGRVVPKSVLEEKLYGIDDELESNAIPVHIHHLRRKLEDASADAEIHTVRGLGYLLTEHGS